jgi:hypothetical protein
MEPLRSSRTRDLPDAGPRPLQPIRRAVDPAPLVGTWVSYDPAEQGLARVVIAGDGERGMTVRAFGVGSPGFVDWGEVAASPFAGGVALREAVGFTAVYDLEGMRVMLAAYLNKRLLVVDAYTRFHHGSGRVDFFARDHFYIP